MVGLDYQLGECIRRGRSAEVFRGTLSDGRAVAIKRFFREPGNEATGNAAAEREAALAATLDHPNLVALLGVERDSEQRLCLVHEWVDGIDAGAWCREGIAPIEATVFLARELLQALHHLHTVAGLLHRDITPDNVLLGWDGTVKLGDLGIARPLDGPITAGMLVRGTPGYMSAEQLDGAELDERSDLFSLGVVLYELLTGRRPFGDTPNEILAALFRATPVVPVNSLRPEAPAVLSDLVGKLIERDRARRWQCTRDVLLVLPACPDGRAALVDSLRRCRRAAHRCGVVPTNMHRGAGPVPSMIDSPAMKRYELELEECIGRGGMAEVWRGWRRLGDGDPERVAVKKIRPGHELEPEAIERFDREARLCLAMNHQYVVKVLDYVREGDERLLVMEYLDGLSLAQIIDRHIVLPHDVLRGTLHRVLQALMYIHDLGVVHRDISPANIMLTRDGEVRLMDFGLFKEMASSGRVSSFKGTPVYASREALFGEALDASSDLYSVAAVFYELLLGKPLHEQGPPHMVALQHFAGPVTPLPDLMPVDFRVALEGLLQPRDKRRRGTAIEVLAELIHHGEQFEAAGPAGIAAVVERAMLGGKKPLAVELPEAPEPPPARRRKTVRMRSSDAQRLLEHVEDAAPRGDVDGPQAGLALQAEQSEQAERAGLALQAGPGRQPDVPASPPDAESKLRRRSSSRAVLLALAASVVGVLVGILMTTSLVGTRAPAVTEQTARNPAIVAPPTAEPPAPATTRGIAGTAPASAQPAAPASARTRTRTRTTPATRAPHRERAAPTGDIESIWQMSEAERLRAATP